MDGGLLGMDGNQKHRNVLCLNLSTKIAASKLTYLRWKANIQNFIKKSIIMCKSFPDGS